MDNSEVNPYQSPESEVINPVGSDAVMNFNRFSAWFVFLLSIVTFGIYPIYWLYTRAVKLNSFHERKISHGLLVAFVVSCVLSFASAFFDALSEEMLVVGMIINFVYFGLYLTVLFTFHGRLASVINKDLNGILTFFFTSIYLQYKINETIDEVNPL